MLPYGLPRNDDVKWPDKADIRFYALKRWKIRAGLRRFRRRYWKKMERRRARREIEIEMMFLGFA